MAIKRKTTPKKDKTYTPTHRSRDRKKRSERLRRILFSVVVLVVVASTVLLLVPRSGTKISIAENALGSLLTPVQSAFSGAVRGVKGFFTTWRNYDTLTAEYNALSREHEQLQLEYDSMQETELENERLRALVSAQSSYESLDPIYAKVIARDAGEWFDTFSINRGTSDGISVGMAVACGDGLIGKVYEAGLNYAKVITVIDPRSSVAVLVQRTRDNGVMRGQITSSSKSSDCYLYYLPNINNVMPGDKVVTSGTDSQYVKGLCVGTVTAVSVGESSDGGYAVVTPTVDFRHIEEVLVLRQVVETDSDQGALPVVSTPTPKAASTLNPNATPSPSPTPTLGPDVFAYPSQSSAASSGDSTIENLPEDAWVDG